MGRRRSAKEQTVRAPLPPGASRSIAAAMCGGLASTLPSLVIASSLTQIASDLGTTVAFLAWAISLPLLGSAIAVPVLGRIGDIVGHRRLFICSMSIVAIPRRRRR